jgi:hypothetical protein
MTELSVSALLLLLVINEVWLVSLQAREMAQLLVVCILAT